MSTEPQNAPVTEVHRQAFKDAWNSYMTKLCNVPSSENPHNDGINSAAQLIANFVASETAALKEMHAGLATSLNEIQNEKMALAKQCALLREALATARKSCAWSYSNSLGSQEIMWELAKDALKAIDKALAATPETASAELAELRKDKERLDWLAEQAIRERKSYSYASVSVGWKEYPEEFTILVHGEDGSITPVDGDTYRSAIDAARKATR